MNTNPFEIVYRYQNELIELEQTKQDIEGKIKDLKDIIARGLAECEATGKESMDGYTCVTERKTTEKRTIKMDIIRENKPELLLSYGKYDAVLATRYLTPSMQRMLLKDPDFDSGYQLGLGELDRALGGKKNSVDYVDVEIKEDIKKRITRMAPDPILEV